MSQPTVKIPAPAAGGQVQHVAPSAAGVPLVTIPTAQLPRYLHKEGDALAHSLAGAEQAGMVTSPTTSAGRLMISLDIARWFDLHSGQFRVAALVYAAQLGRVLAARPAQVVWVVGRGPGAGGIASLSARRAASLAAALHRQGVPAARLRLITRPPRVRAAATLEIVVKPLQTGKFALAWMPPN